VILHFLALDTVCAVLAWNLLASSVLGTANSPLLLFWTGAAVWLVYIADRWLDSLPNSTEEHLSERHLFAARHRGVIAIIWLGVWLISIMSALIQLPGKILLAGAFIAAMGVIYLILIQRTPHEDKKGRRRAGGGIVVGPLVALAVILFPALNGSPKSTMIGVTWALIAWGFCLQTRSSRIWEEGGSISMAKTIFGGLTGCVLALSFGLLPIAAATVSLTIGLVLLNRFPLKDKVMGADWLLAIAGTVGWLAS